MLLNRLHLNFPMVTKKGAQGLKIISSYSPHSFHSYTKKYNRTALADSDNKVERRFM